VSEIECVGSQVLEMSGGNSLVPIANVLFLADGTPQIAMCLFVCPSALMRLA